MNPIEHLLEEHRDIMAQVADLRTAVRDLAARGEAALPEALPVLRRIGHMMETQLARHAQKEDEALFPAVEAILGEESGPTVVMRAEHRGIHGQGQLLRQTLHELNAIEHLAIKAGGKSLLTAAATGDNADVLRATAEAIIDLLDVHFDKEEQVLFPMALQLLDVAALEEVARKMEAIA